MNITQKITNFLFGPKVWDCERCRGYGRINHRCGMVCVDDPCPDCDERGYHFTPPSARLTTYTIPMVDEIGDGMHDETFTVKERG